MMDTAMLDSHLQKLEELVYDEDKIVTCVTLAELLKISIQDAKQLVSKFVEDQRQSKPQELSVTYLLSGILKGAQFPSVHLVKEHDLKRKKAAFDKVICEILYSVQRSNDIDFNIIAQVEKVHPDNPRQSSLIGSVVSKNCVKRKLRPRKIPEPPPPKQIVKKKPSFFTNVETKNEKEAENKTKAETKNEKATENNKAAPAKENNKSKQDVKGKGKGGLANFLTKGAQKSVCVVKPTVKSSEDNKTEEHVNGKDEKSTEKEEKEKPQVAKEKMEVDEDDDTKKKESTASKSKEPSTAGKKSKKKRPNKENNEQPNKKRRRIVQKDDSDSDDMFGDNEDNYDDVVERIPDEEPEPSPVQKVPLAPKNKIRKAVDKTYEDEDGFIVTRTEYVLESASEDEKEEAKSLEKPPQKPSVSEEKKKLNSSKSESDISPKNNKPTKGKKGKKAPAANQPTLMNFFKKK